MCCSSCALWNVYFRQHSHTSIGCNTELSLRELSTSFPNTHLNRFHFSFLHRGYKFLFKLGLCLFYPLSECLEGAASSGVLAQFYHPVSGIVLRTPVLIPASKTISVRPALFYFSLLIISILIAHACSHYQYPIICVFILPLLNFCVCVWTYHSNSISTTTDLIQECWQLLRSFCFLWHTCLNLFVFLIPLQCFRVSILSIENFLCIQRLRPSELRPNHTLLHTLWGTRASVCMRARFVQPYAGVCFGANYLFNWSWLVHFWFCCRTFIRV